MAWGYLGGYRKWPISSRSRVSAEVKTGLLRLTGISPGGYFEDEGKLGFPKDDEKWKPKVVTSG